MESEIMDLGAGVDVSDEIHHLPCCIKYDGASPVSDYFKPKSTGIQIDGLAVKEAHLRGRKLQGTTLPIPHGFSGFVIGRKSSSWQVNANFRNITVWNHDTLPSKDDTFLRAFHWFDVANALHKPVTPEQMESASNPRPTTTTED